MTTQTGEVLDLLSKLHSFAPLLRLLNLSGMLPPLSIYKVPWKNFLYNIFSLLTFLSFIPLIIMQLTGFYVYGNKLNLILVIAFQLAAYFDGMVTMAYFVWNRKRLLTMFLLMETKFIPLMSKVGRPEKQKTILAKNWRFCKVITTVAIGAFLADMATWCVLPSVVRYMAYLHEEEEVEGEPEHKMEYFVLVMWLPQNATAFPRYEMLHVFQFFSVWGVVANYAAGKLIIVTLFYHLATHFNILSSAIQDIDDICVNELSANEDMRLVVKQLAISHETNDSSVIEGALNLNLRSKIVQEKRLCPVDLDPDNINVKESDIFGRLTYPDEVTYLTDCVIYHQELLKFCREINSFLTNILLFDLVIFQILMCLPPLQLVLGQDASTFRFVSSIVDTGIWPLLICFWGEAVSQESLGVRKAAYDCQWYNRSQAVKRLLQMVLMRTREPVRMTAGQFYNLSLETFADIENKVYAYFTLLKNMQG
ncbi:Odorant receptor 1 [Blattella germanica]|nr:Odorant receptor 1 [Blattella germanica]